MNSDRAQEILMLYRPGTADAGDAEMGEALACVRQDPVLRGWFAKHCAAQEAIRAQFRRIPVPEGLKEQILSERRVFLNTARRRNVVLAAVAAVVLAAALASLSWPLRRENTLANFSHRMISAAVRGYQMDLESTDLGRIKAFLAQNQAPANYAMPAGLQKAVPAGCAVQKWQGTKVSMICFRTGRPLPRGEQSDLWLFVADRAAVKGAPAGGPPVITRINSRFTASWTQGEMFYLLGTEADEQALRQYL